MSVFIFEALGKQRAAKQKGEAKGFTWVLLRNEARRRAKLDMASWNKKKRKKSSPAQGSMQFKHTGTSSKTKIERHHTAGTGGRGRRAALRKCEWRKCVLYTKADQSWS
eukprot:297172-Pelagomonas_calceolata.AAC.2